MTRTIPKPPAMHGRDQEWADLSRFATKPDVGATLGLLYGRLRQGKTFMLAQLVAATGGFMFTGLPQTSEQNLRDLATAFARYKNLPEYAFASWRAAVDELMRLGEESDRPVPVVLDEFPFLLDTAPVDGLIQVALEPLSRAQERSRTRLVLCGSALTTMQAPRRYRSPPRARHPGNGCPPIRFPRRGRLLGSCRRPGARVPCARLGRRHTGIPGDG